MGKTLFPFWTLIRYADDMVIMCKRKALALESIRVLKGIFGKLELEMNTEKSRLVNLRDDSEGFDFLGFRHRKFPKKVKEWKSILYTRTCAEQESDEENVSDLQSLHFTTKQALFRYLRFRGGIESENCRNEELLLDYPAILKMDSEN